MGFITALPTGAEVQGSDLAAISKEIGGLFVVKTVDETVTSSATLQDDNELFIAALANKTYVLGGLLIYASNATPLFKVGWTVPAGATLNWTIGGMDNSVTAANNGNIDRALYTQATAATIGVDGVANSIVATPSGLLTMGSTAGNLQCQWAQAVSNGVGSIMKAGSYLTLLRVV